MALKLVLDTNTYSAWKRGDSRVAALFRRATWIGLSAVVIGELLYGFRIGSRFTQNRSELDAFLADPDVSLLRVGLVTADRYGRICAQLRQSGQPIPSNDIWIAAHAFETGAELVSFDRRFEAVAGLSWLHPND